MDLLGQLVGALDRLAGHRRDHVAAFDARFRGGAVTLNARDDRAMKIVRTKAIGNLGRNGLNFGSHRSARHDALFLQLRYHRLDGVRGYCEGNSRRASGWRKDHAVDADDIALGVEAWSAGIAAVDRCVDLDEALGRTHRDFAFSCRDDTRRDRAFEPERIAHGEYPIADARRPVGELHVAEVAASVDLDQSEAAQRIASYNLGRVNLVVAGA